jgi:hypothetical protein
MKLAFGLPPVTHHKPTPYFYGKKKKDIFILAFMLYFVFTFTSITMLKCACHQEYCGGD